MSLVSSYIPDIGDWLGIPSGRRVYQVSKCDPGRMWSIKVWGRVIQQQILSWLFWVTTLSWVHVKCKWAINWIWSWGDRVDGPLIYHTEWPHPHLHMFLLVYIRGRYLSHLENHPKIFPGVFFCAFCSAQNYCSHLSSFQSVYSLFSVLGLFPHFLTLSSSHWLVWYFKRNTNFDLVHFSVKDW